MQVFDNDQNWHVHHGDCIPHMLQDMPEESVDFAIFSPPFPALYAYLDSVADIGNVDAMGGEAAVAVGVHNVLERGAVGWPHMDSHPGARPSACGGRGCHRGEVVPASRGDPRSGRLPPVRGCDRQGGCVDAADVRPRGAPCPGGAHVPRPVKNL